VRALTIIWIWHANCQREIQNEKCTMTADSGATSSTSATSSPHFRKRPRCSTSPCSYSSSSDYFTQSLGSALGAAKSLGPLVVCLAGSSPTEFPLCSRENSFASCAACTLLVDQALVPFKECSIFQERWGDCSGGVHCCVCCCCDGDETAECWRRAQDRLNKAVRHLCGNRCYMKAFAPYRRWYSLRQHLGEDLEIPSVNLALSGWRCTLLSDGSTLPRTAFLSPDGKRFYTFRQVTKELRTTRRFSKKRGRSQLPPDSFFMAPTESPYGLLEELFVDDPWRLLLSTILLNRTTRVQVDPGMTKFLENWPTCEAVLRDADNVSHMIEILRPLGICYRRAAGILRFSREYSELLSQGGQAFHLTKMQVVALFHCGEYAYAAYRLFIKKEFNFDPGDHALRTYAEYHRGLA
jgi:hypothetical protein